MDNRFNNNYVYKMRTVTLSATLDEREEENWDLLCKELGGSGYRAQSVTFKKLIRIVRGERR